MAAISKDHQEIGLKISKLRDQAGMAQIDLAEELGVGRTKISAVERGETDFGISTLLSVCDVFEVAPSEILPDRLKADSGLDSGIQALADKLSLLKPYERSQLMNALNAMVDAFVNSRN